MKRILPLLLLTLYIGSFSGVMLNLHYCGGKLSLVRLFSKPSEIDCCGQVEMDDCCHDHSTWIKNETAHAHANQIVLTGNLYFKVISFLSEEFPKLRLEETKDSIAYLIGIPISIRPPLSILEQTNVFRI